LAAVRLVLTDLPWSESGRRLSNAMLHGQRNNIAQVPEAAGDRARVGLRARSDRLRDRKPAVISPPPGKDANILLRSKVDYDGDEPSPNSVAALNLLRLAQMLSRADWRQRAGKTLGSLNPQFEKPPSAMPQMLVALDWLRAKQKLIVIAGKPDAPDTLALLHEVNRHFIPDKIVLLPDGGADREFLATHVDFMKDVTPSNGEATAYVCENFVCKLPTAKPDVLAQLLSGWKAIGETPPPERSMTTPGKTP
jgi:uncharacterized protein YyaL (SSP411 family)